MSKILVTGGSGFIGAHVVEQLVKRGDEVTVYDRKAPFLFDIPKDSYQYMAGDTRDKDKVLQAVYDHDAVMHLAGLLGTAESFGMVPEFVDINVTGSVNVFDAIKQTKKKAAYICVGNQWLNAYTITKMASANLALMYNREFGTQITVIRGLNVYGEKQRWFPTNKYFPRFCVSLIEGKKIPIFGTGEQEIDLVHVHDTASALVKAIDTDFGKDQYEQILDAGTGVAVTVNDCARMVIAAHLKIPAKAVTNEQFEYHVEYLPLRPGEPADSHTVGDVASINQILGFVPTTNLEDGIRTAYDWYAKNYRRFYA